MTTAIQTSQELYQEFCTEIYKVIPQQYFVTDLKENKIGHIKIALVREVINKLIVRSTDMEATVVMVANFNGTDIELIEIPARKLKSREKLLGVEICRKLGVMPDGYHYNVLENRDALKNPNSVLFGDTVTKGNIAAGFASRAIYDWAYSIRDVKDLTEKLQHNSMGEDGTILKAEGDPTKPASNALHQTEYVNQGAFFSHFITLDNVTPGLFLHLIFCVLHQHAYGAQSTTNSENMNNHLVAIGFDDFEKPINSYTISKKWNQTKIIHTPTRQEAAKEMGETEKRPSQIEAPTLDSLKQFAVQEMKLLYGAGNVIADEGGNAPKTKLADLLTYVNSVWQNEEFLKAIYEQVAKDSKQYGKDIKL